MDTDQIKGKLQNAFGKVEEAVGEAVGSQNLSNAGAEDRLKGAATRKIRFAAQQTPRKITRQHTQKALGTVLRPARNT